MFLLEKGRLLGVWGIKVGFMEEEDVKRIRVEKRRRRVSVGD